MTLSFRRFAGAALVAATCFAPLAASAETTVASGSFVGASNHVTTGGVSVVRTDGGGAVVILDRDFSLDGAPDPHVAFGKDGTYVEMSDLGDLAHKDGFQVFVVSDGIDVGDFDTVFIWCNDVGVPLGLAALN